MLTHLVEVLLVEALRATPREDAPPGLLRGLADARLAPALRELHGQVERSWTVTQLARAAALSRSAFFERFTRTVGVPPMEYLLAWRMALAKDLLTRGELALAEIAERIGYGSASSFSTAFSRARRRAAEPVRGAGPKAGARVAPLYGLVVDSVNVSVLLYVPVRSGSLAPIDCLKPIVTASLEVGPFHVLTVRRDRRVGAADAGLQRLRQRERAVDELAGVVRARVRDAQRRVTRRRDHGRGRGREVVPRDARRERAERGRRAERERERRRHRAADAAALAR